MTSSVSLWAVLAYAEERQELQKLSRKLIELRANQLINRQPNANSMRRPTSVIGGRADMARTCQYVC